MLMGVKEDEFYFYLTSMMSGSTFPTTTSGPRTSLVVPKSAGENLLFAARAVVGQLFGCIGYISTG